MRNALLFAALVLFVPARAAAEPVGGFIAGGLSFASYEAEDSSGTVVELENGKGLSLGGGIRWQPGLMVKGDFTYTEHDGGDFSGPLGSGSFSDDVEVSEARLGLFWSPPQRSTAGYRVGGGYESIELEIPSLSAQSEVDGPFAEGAVVLRAGRSVTFDLGGSLMFLEDDDGQDANGAEFRAGMTFVAGPVDIGGVFRVLALDTDVDGGGSTENTFMELRVTVGTTWGYPES